VYNNYTYRAMKTIINIVRKISKIVFFFRKIFLPENKDLQDMNLPLKSTGDIKSNVKEILPKKALNMYLYFYNREYQKYELFKDLNKTIRLMTREEFAHKRALILTLKKLSDGYNFKEEKKILNLLHEKNIEAIERELKKVKEEINT